MKNISVDDIEIRAIKEAYDALKCLDDAGRSRALHWLFSKFGDEEQQGRKARHEATLKRISPNG